MIENFIQRKKNPLKKISLNTNLLFKEDFSILKNGFIVFNLTLDSSYFSMVENKKTLFYYFSNCIVESFFNKSVFIISLFIIKFRIPFLFVMNPFFKVFLWKYLLIRLKKKIILLKNKQLFFFNKIFSKFFLPEDNKVLPILKEFLINRKDVSVYYKGSELSRIVEKPLFIIITIVRGNIFFVLTDFTGKTLVQCSSGFNISTLKGKVNNKNIVLTSVNSFKHFFFLIRKKYKKNFKDKFYYIIIKLVDSSRFDLIQTLLYVIVKTGISNFFILKDFPQAFNGCRWKKRLVK